MIPVTKTFLPPIEEYYNYLQIIWKNGWITNNGQVVKQFEKTIKNYLGAKHFFFVNNGTIALQIAIKSLELPKNSEIITTPFSYVATTSSIIWEGYKPIFVDINPETLCIDENKIEEKITKKTKAILPTHVFGYTCNIEKIKKIANKYNLKIIYDAAHTFGVKYKEKHIVNYGDISILSFHATKIFHTGEGGGLITNDDKLAHKISYMRNFGHHGEYDYWGLGINGKSSELHAAMGLSVFPYLGKIINERNKICKIYDKYLFSINCKLKKPKFSKSLILNYAYYPIIFPSEKALLNTLKIFNENNIFPRRYFYPSLNKLPYVKNVKMPISEEMSKRILCLPLYYGLKEKDIKKIIKCLIF